jgi:hypothetical protein
LAGSKRNNAKLADADDLHRQGEAMPLLTPRQADIIALARDTGRLDVDALAAHFGVTPPTKSAFSRGSDHELATVFSTGARCAVGLLVRWPALYISSPIRTEEVNLPANVMLLEKIGPAIVLTHSQSGVFGWKLADLRPDLGGRSRRHRTQWPAVPRCGVARRQGVVRVS